MNKLKSISLKQVYWGKGKDKALFKRRKQTKIERKIFYF